MKATSGVAPEAALDKPVGNPPQPVRVDDWSREWVIEETNPGVNGPNDIWILPLAPGRGNSRKSYPYLHSPFAELFARLSPDGRWLAYQTSESGFADIYVVTFPQLGGKWAVTSRGGSKPVWSRDGKELYFLSNDLKMMAVEVKANGDRFDFSAPRPLFDVRMRNDPSTGYDVGPDGRFLIPEIVAEAASAPISVMINWPAGLRK